jgi:hypothetical protein
VLYNPKFYLEEKHGKDRYSLLFLINFFAIAYYETIPKTAGLTIKGE